MNSIFLRLVKTNWEKENNKQITHKKMKWIHAWINSRAMRIFNCHISWDLTFNRLRSFVRCASVIHLMPLILNFIVKIGMSRQTAVKQSRSASRSTQSSQRSGGAPSSDGSDSSVLDFLGMRHHTGSTTTEHSNRSSTSPESEVALKVN